jgi:tetratricopeptide (TPR) repeat protein
MGLDDLRATAYADRKDVLAWSTYGDRLLTADQGERAATAYQQAVEALPIGDTSGMARAIVAKAAHVLARFGTEQQAVSLLERAQRIAPDSVDTILAVGIMAMRRQDFEGAQPLFERATQLAPRDSETWNRLGTCLLAQEKPKLAEAPLRRSVELAPSNAAAHADLAESLAQQNRFGEAVNEYAEAARLAPAVPDYASQHSMASANAARSDEDYEMAATLLVTALQQTPDDAALSLTLAGLQMRFGRMEEARRTYEMIVGRLPDHSDAWFNLSNVYTRLGDTGSATIARRRFQQILDRQTAIVELTKKSLMNPQSAGAHSALADALKASGDTQAAYRELRKATELAPNDAKLRAKLDEAQQSLQGGRPAGSRGAN